MSVLPPKTMICPHCGNINAYDTENCLKCGLALAPIRDAMAKIGTSGATEILSAPPKTKEPLPPLPSLITRSTTEEIGNCYDSWRCLIRGMGDHANDIASRFFKQLKDHGMTEIILGQGQLVIENDRRDYYFAERNLGQGAKATMAIRIAANDRDLFVEWRHYILTSKELGSNDTISALGCFGVAAFWMLWGLAGIIFTNGMFGSYQMFCGSAMWAALFGGVGAVILIRGSNKRRNSLKGFQSQDSTAFQLAVRAALEEAIDLAGISKTLIQELPTEKSKGRVI